MAQGNGGIIGPVKRNISSVRIHKRKTSSGDITLTIRNYVLLIQLVVAGGGAGGAPWWWRWAGGLRNHSNSVFRNCNSYNWSWWSCSWTSRFKGASSSLQYAEQHFSYWRWWRWWSFKCTCMVPMEVLEVVQMECSCR